MRWSQQVRSKYRYLNTLEVDPSSDHVPVEWIEAWMSRFRISPCSPRSRPYLLCVIAIIQEGGPAQSGRALRRLHQVVSRCSGPIPQQERRRNRAPPPPPRGTAVARRLPAIRAQGRPCHRPRSGQPVPPLERRSKLGRRKPIRLVPASGPWGHRNQVGWL